MILLIFVADHIETLDTPKAAGLSSCSTTSSEVGQGRWLEDLNLAVERRFQMAARTLKRRRWRGKVELSFVICFFLTPCGTPGGVMDRLVLFPAFASAMHLSPSREKQFEFAVLSHPFPHSFDPGSGSNLQRKFSPTS